MTYQHQAEETHKAMSRRAREHPAQDFDDHVPEPQVGCWLVAALMSMFWFVAGIWIGAAL